MTIIQTAARRLTPLLLCALLATPAMAGAFPTHHAVAPAPVTVSPWAQAQVDEARDLGFDIDYILNDSSQADIHLTAMNRETFAQLALNYVALQNGFPYATYLIDLTNQHLTPQDADGQLILPFSDAGDPSLVAAHTLALIQGREDGTFDGQAAITRQEAATLLTRAYLAIGGPLPDTDALPYTDAAAIADWAKESVAVMSALNIMNGLPDGAFAPTDPYSVEQCIVTFTRLCTNAPVSRQSGGAEPFFTYQQVNDYLPTSLTGLTDVTEGLRIAGPLADLVRLDWSFPGHLGPGYTGSAFYLVGHEGSLQDVDFGLCNASTGLTPALDLRDAAFSDDGTTFTCTIHLAEDVYSAGTDTSTLLHAQGVYPITLHVPSATLIPQE